MSRLDRWRKRKVEPEEIEALRYFVEIAEPEHAARLEADHRRLIEESGEIPAPAEYAAPGSSLT